MAASIRALLLILAWAVAGPVLVIGVERSETAHIVQPAARTEQPQPQQRGAAQAAVSEGASSNSSLCKNQLETLPSAWDHVSQSARERLVLDVLRKLNLEDPTNYAVGVRLLASRDTFFHVNHSSGSRSFIACMVPRVLSRRASYLLLRYGNGNEPFLILTREVAELPSLALAAALSPSFSAPSLAQLVNPRVPRLLVVRNPYIRILSFFLMDPARRQVCQFMYGSACSPASRPAFPAFVDALYERWFMSQGPIRRPNMYWSRRLASEVFPQSWFCAQPVGMEFNLVVKVEELAARLKCLVERLGMQSEVKRGWRYLNFRQSNSTTDDCFFKPSPALACDWMTNPRVDVEYILAQQGWNATIAFTPDVVPILPSTLQAHYTEKARRQVAEMYEQDFLAYKYSFDLPA